MLPVQIGGPAASSDPKARLYVTACLDRKAGEIVMKVVNPTAAPVETAVKLQGMSRVASPATATILASNHLTAENSLAEPAQVTPQTMTVPNVGPEFRYTFQAQSLTVLRLKAK